MIEYKCTEKQTFEILTKNVDRNATAISEMKKEINLINRNDGKIELAVDTLTKRMDAAELTNSQLNTLTTNMAVMVEQMANMNKKIDTNSENTNNKIDAIAGDVDILKTKSSKDYEYYKREIIKWSILLLLGFIAGYLQLK